MQTQATPPAVLHLAATKPKQRFGTNRDLPVPTSGFPKTSVVTTEVFSQATSAKPKPEHCTTEQLFEIVIDVARRFRTAKEIVAEHRDYIMRLKAEVFKVRFGSFGVRVPVKCRVGGSRPQTRRMLWKEFCEEQFGVSADWINRICGGKAESPGQDASGNSTPDWKTTLIRLINALEQCGDSLPLLAAEALHSAQEVLEATQNDSDAGTPDPDVAALGQISANRMSSELVIARADARHIPLPSNSVQCVITSPPYWALRKYAGNQELVWGGAEGCGHEWDAICRLGQATPKARAGRFGESGGSGRIEKPSEQITVIQSHASCYLCGAWRGEFGLEPTIEMYVQHSMEILREVRRVLRDDGVCFWNVGDSYSGSGKGQLGNGNHAAKHGAKQHTNTGTLSGGLPTSYDGLKPKDLCLIPARVALAAQADGWWVRSDIIWAKPNPMPESVTDRPTDAYEHILMLTKSPHYYWNADAVKEPAAWERWGKQTTLSHDENQRVMPNKSKEELQENTTRNPRNIWTFATQPYSGAHFAVFPEELPRRCIRAASRPGDVVLDPFAGAGTTGILARELGRNAVLLDVSEDYVQLMTQRLKGKNNEQSEIDSGDPRLHPWSTLVA